MNSVELCVPDLSGLCGTLCTSGFRFKFYNRNKSAVVVVFLFFCFNILIYGQKNKIPEMIITIAERLAANSDDPYLVTAYTDRLNELAEEPVKLNNPSEKEISRLFFLTDFQVKSLAQYIKSSGPVLSQQELSNIPGFDNATAEMASPFCDFSNRGAGYSPHGINGNFLSNVSFRPGEADTSLSGSPVKMLMKFNAGIGKFSGGFTAEKDAGERLASPLPDFYSAYILYSGSGFLKRAVAGDYSLRFGQGSALNTSVRPALTLSTPGFLSVRNELRPYRSTDENNFFRGVAVTVGNEKAELSLFASRNYIDATLAWDSASASPCIDGFYTQGYHTTPSEINKKDNVSETSFGANASYSTDNTKIGMLFNKSGFSIPVLKQPGMPESAFDFYGSSNTIISAYYSTVLKRILLFGELSVSNFDKAAFTQGVSVRPSSRFSVNVLYRNYQPGYIAFHGNGPGTGSTTTNEKGIFGNLTFEAAKHLFISGGCDAVIYPWLRYQNSSPSRGWRNELRVLFNPTDKLRIDAWYTRRMTTVDDQAENGIPCQAEKTITGIKLVTRYSPDENFSLTIRADYRMTEPGNSRGSLILSDVFFRFGKIPLAVWYRYCLFSTSDWDSRLYTYENDLVWSYSVPAMSGQGSRSYMMIALDTGNRSEIRVKYGITSIKKIPAHETGSDELKFQFRMVF